MGKKVKEFKSGDFIFAKVKGYPAWPARVQRLNGKKYFVYFYGTGETANLAPNMIFDYADNKDKFLTKSVKRRDFNDGVKQIEHDFANNVPLDQVIGSNIETPMESANDTANDSAINETMDDTAMDTTADDTVGDTTANTTQNDAVVEDSDETGALVIDEGKQPKSKKSKTEATKTPAKEIPKTPKTPRGKSKKDEKEENEGDEDERREEEIVSRSGRKIRPKRYIDEQTEENSTLPSPASKKRRGGSPGTDKDKAEPKEKAVDKKIKQFNTVPQSELEDLKEPYKPADAEKENILITYLPSGQYAGIKLFQSRPTNFKNNSAKLQWDKQAASNAVTLKMQLERGQITPQSVMAQLVMDLHLTDEEKATLDKERETGEKKSRVQFLRTEMKLIELDSKIKTCLCLEKADTETCLALLDELMELEVKPLMLLKHPTCLETVKRMRAYVGNTPSWDLSETAALDFSKQAHRIRKQADNLYKNMKDLFVTPAGLSFWEYFSERVLQFKKGTAKLNADELLEMVHEPLELSVPTAHTNTAAVELANKEDASVVEENDTQKSHGEENEAPKQSQEGQKEVQKKVEKSARKKSQEDDKEVQRKMEKAARKKSQEVEKDVQEKGDKEVDKKGEDMEVENKEEDDVHKKTVEKESQKKSSGKSKKPVNSTPSKPQPKRQTPRKAAPQEEKEKEVGKKLEETENNDTIDKDNTESESSKAPEPEKETPIENSITKTVVTVEVQNVDPDKEEEMSETVNDKESQNEKEKSEEEKDGKKEKQDFEEPRAKRSRGENKKIEPPLRSPAKRKSKN